MRQFTKKAAQVILAIAVIAGCKKDDNSSPTKTQLLTTGNWIVIANQVNPAIDANGDGVLENDIFAVSPQCYRDNITTFKTDGTYTIDEGATKCNASDPQIEESSYWKFSDNETKMLVGDPGSEQTFQVLELSGTVLTVRTVIESGSVTLTETLTFAHGH